jgi:hypothetical protein
MRRSWKLHLRKCGVSPRHAGWRSWKLHLLGKVAERKEVRRLAAPKKLGRKSRKYLDKKAERSSVVVV